MYSIVTKTGELYNQFVGEDTKHVDSFNAMMDAVDDEKYCGANDTCHTFVKFEKDGSAIIRCTKGIYKGQEKCLSFNSDTNKYASGCSITNIFAHHYTFERAAYLACD